MIKTPPYIADFEFPFELDETIGDAIIDAATRGKFAATRHQERPNLRRIRVEFGDLGSLTGFVGSEIDRLGVTRFASRGKLANGTDFSISVRVQGGSEHPCKIL